MRILIDECIDERLRYDFPAHDCHTARYAKLSGLKNGDLLTAPRQPDSTQLSRLTKAFRFSKT